MVIGGRSHECKTKLLISIANDIIRTHNVFFFNCEESDFNLYEKGLDSSTNVLNDKFKSIIDLLEMMSKVNDNNKTNKPNYFIFDNIGLLVEKSNIKDMIKILSNIDNVSFSYNLIRERY